MSFCLLMFSPVEMRLLRVIPFFYYSHSRKCVCRNRKRDTRTSECVRMFFITSVQCKLRLHCKNVSVDHEDTLLSCLQFYIEINKIHFLQCFSITSNIINILKYWWYRYTCIYTHREINKHTQLTLSALNIFKRWKCYSIHLETFTRKCFTNEFTNEKMNFFQTRIFVLLINFCYSSCYFLLFYDWIYLR